MKSKVLNYRILVEKETQKNKKIYIAYAPSLGISDFGSSIEEAVANIEKAMTLYLDTLIELKQPIPEPDTEDYFVTTRKIEIKTHPSHIV